MAITILKGLGPKTKNKDILGPSTRPSNGFPR
jgi:hypothetical protein